jgi:hypothetical protein
MVGVVLRTRIQVDQVVQEAVEVAVAEHLILQILQAFNQVNQEIQEHMDMVFLVPVSMPRRLTQEVLEVVPVAQDNLVVVE